MKRSGIGLKWAIDAEQSAVPNLGALVHGVVNSTAAITFSAGALRAAGELTGDALEAIARMEQAADLVTQMIKTFATASRAAESTAGAGATGVDLYDVCCEVAERHRERGGPTISCRAFGDSRGGWAREQVVELVTLMVDSALAHLGAGSLLTLAASGFGRHVRLDLCGLGWLSPRARQACLEIPSKVDASLGGLMTVTVSQGGGTVLSMHLPRVAGAPAA
ncbi:MAG TPA: hypothetical protein VHO06_22215 [Polyangia bacterium]|nr:hypothetical protein [Polyangia bacterium]